MKYLKGQLHLHTSISDGDATPIQVAQEYKEMGYDFIYFTDHIRNYDVSDIKEEGILTFPGAEWAAVVKNPYYNSIHSIHINALGKYLADWGIFKYWSKEEMTYYKVPNVEKIEDASEFEQMFNTSAGDVINELVNEAYRLGVIPTINHPVWHGINWNKTTFDAYDYRELLKVKRPYILEVKNASIGDDSNGCKTLESVEYVWDVLLSNGKDVFCAFTDDSHEYGKDVRLIVDKNTIPEHLVPRNFHIMVKADSNQESIEKSLKNCDFYASTGVEIEEYTVSDKSIYVKVKDIGKTNNIIFKGRMGMPLKWSIGNEAEFVFTGSPDEEYVRVKVADSDYKMALTQPVFQNGKKIKLL